MKPQPALGPAKANTKLPAAGVKASVPQVIVPKASVPQPINTSPAVGNQTTPSHIRFTRNIDAVDPDDAPSSPLPARKKSRPNESLTQAERIIKDITGHVSSHITTYTSSCEKTIQELRLKLNEHVETIERQRLEMEARADRVGEYARTITKCVDSHNKELELNAAELKEKVTTIETLSDEIKTLSEKYGSRRKNIKKRKSEIKEKDLEIRSQAEAFDSKIEEKDSEIENQNRILDAKDAKFSSLQRPAVLKISHCRSRLFGLSVPIPTHVYDCVNYLGLGIVSSVGTLDSEF